MKRPTTKPIEAKCPACNGIGFPEVKQPAQPGRKIYRAPCTKCGGKEAANIPQKAAAGG
jgi:DnaJ-class molecular chaperone